MFFAWLALCALFYSVIGPPPTIGPLLVVVSRFLGNHSPTLPPPTLPACRDARVYGHTTTAMHEIEDNSSIEYNPLPSTNLTINLTAPTKASKQP